MWPCSNRTTLYEIFLISIFRLLSIDFSRIESEVEPLPDFFLVGLCLSLALLVAINEFH